MKYDIGRLVEHKASGQRGVIVNYDDKKTPLTYTVSFGYGQSAKVITQEIEYIDWDKPQE